MYIRMGPMIKNAHAYCTGCHKVVYMHQRYIQLELNNIDNSLQEKDLSYAYFHTEHCIALMIKQSEDKW